MGSGRKRSLPVVAALVRKETGAPAAAPSVDVARKRLGGRVPAPAKDHDPTLGSTRSAGHGDAGRIVTLGGAAGLQAVGVVLYGADGMVDVWIEGGVVRRSPRDAVEDFTGVVGDDLEAMAADARHFARLREGQRVRFAPRPGEREEGDLVEKCRYGALVLRADGKLMAVGFRRIWAYAPEVDAPN